VFERPKIVRALDRAVIGTGGHQIKEEKWVGLVACMGEMRNASRILFRKPKSKRPVARPGRIMLE
jgi:hypothetical protein